MTLEYLAYLILLLIAIRGLYRPVILLLAFVYVKLLMRYRSKFKQSPTGEGVPEKKTHNGIIYRLKILMEGLLLYSSTIVGSIYSQKIRLLLYRRLFQMKIGKNVVVYNNLQIRQGHNIRIGSGSIVGDHCTLDGRNGIEIGSNVNISSGVWIWTEQHNTQSPLFDCIDAGGKVTIGDRAWISSRVTILPGITIGQGAVIAANAVVTKDVDPFCIYGGIPARKIGTRNENLVYDLNGEYLPFF